MRVVLFILMLVPAIFAQKFIHVPANPQEIVRFKQQYVFSDKEPIYLYKFFDEDKKLIVVGKQTIRVWDTKNGKVLSTVSHDIAKDKHFNYGSKISPDATKLVATDTFRWKRGKEKTALTANVYDLTTGKFLAELNSGSRSIRFAYWSENGDTLVTHEEPTYFSSDAKDSEVCFWDGDTLDKRACKILPGSLRWTQPSKDGKQLYAEVRTPELGDADQIYLLDTKTAAELDQIDTGDQMWWIARPLSPSGEIFVNPSASSIQVLRTGEKLSKMFELSEPGKKYFPRFSFGAFSSDEKRFAIRNDKNMAMYETRSGRLIKSFPADSAVPKYWANNDTVLISNTCDKATGYSAETGALLYNLKLVCKDYFAVAETISDDEDLLSVHPNGGKYLLTHSGSAVRIWNTADGELLQTVVAPGRDAEKARNPKSDDQIKGRSSQWSDDGKYLYIHGQDGRSILQYEVVRK